MKKENSSIIALERLKLILANEKCEINEELQDAIHQEIGAVIMKYMDMEPEDVHVKIILKEYKKKELC